MTFIYWTLYEQLILFEDYILTKGCFHVAYFIAENIFWVFGCLLIDKLREPFLCKHTSL